MTAQRVRSSAFHNDHNASVSTLRKTLPTLPTSQPFCSRLVGQSVNRHITTRNVFASNCNFMACSKLELHRSRELLIQLNCNCC